MKWQLFYHRVKFQWITPILLALLPMSVIVAQYHVYSDVGNVRAPHLLETRDGGWLLISSEDCYTPGSVTIEGCTYALFLVKTDMQGDTLWTNRFGFSGEVYEVYENEDGTFTLIGTDHQSWKCDNIYVGLWGFSQIQLINVTSTGERINTVSFPHDCEILMRDVIRIGDKRFATLSAFGKPIYWDYPEEGRLSIMDHHGNIEKEIAFPGTDFHSGKLIGSANEILVFFADTNRHLYLKRYDYNLQELGSVTNTILLDSFFQVSSAGIHRQVLQNGDLAFSFHHHWQDTLNYLFIRFDQQLNADASQVHTFYRPENFRELPDGRLVLISTVKSGTEKMNTGIHYLDPDGDVLSSTIVSSPDEESPIDVIVTSAEEVVVAGEYNCCNRDTLIGPGKVFILFERDLTTSSGSLHGPIPVQVFPNPASDVLYFQCDWSAIPDHNLRLNLYDAMGRLVTDQEFTKFNPSMSIRTLVAGGYFFVIRASHTMVAKGTFIKEP